MRNAVLGGQMIGPPVRIATLTKLRGEVHVARASLMIAKSISGSIWVLEATLMPLVSRIIGMSSLEMPPDLLF